MEPANGKSPYMQWGYADTVFEVNATDANIVKPEAGEADTTALKAAVEKAEALKEADYTADSWKAMQLELRKQRIFLQKKSQLRQRLMKQQLI